MEIAFETRAKNHILGKERAITIDISRKVNRGDENSCESPYFPCVRLGRANTLKFDNYMRMTVDEIDVFLYYELLEHFNKISIDLAGVACFKMLIATGTELETAMDMSAMAGV